MRTIRDWMLNPQAEPTKWAQRLEDAKIPQRYWSAKVDLIERAELKDWTKGALGTTKEWLGSGTGFFLHGPLASGKSSIAAILAMDVTRRAETVLWIPSRDVPGVIFNRDKDGSSEGKLYKRLCRCDLLVLDDLGAETFKLTGPAGAAYEAVLRIVYDRARSLIVTSNINWKQFVQIYAPSAPPLVSVLERLVVPQTVVNEQWVRRLLGSGSTGAKP